MPENGQIKRYRRFKGWDYAKGASLFITIATAPRRPLFGRIVNGATALSPLGEKVKEALEAIPLLNPRIMDSAINVSSDHALQQSCLPGFDQNNDGQTGIGPRRRGL